MKNYDLTHVFRGLVLASGLLYLLYFFFPVIRPELVSQKEIELLELNGFGALFFWPLWLQWATFVANVLVVIGLFFFNSFARTFFVLLTLFFLVTGLGLGLEVSTAVESFCSTLLTLVDGAILALSFTPPVSNCFLRNPTKLVTDSENRGPKNPG